MNKFLSFCAIFAILSFTNAAPPIPTSTKNSACTLTAIYQSGCTANICFAIDGSGSVTFDEFRKAAVFAQDVSNTLAFFQDTEYAAVKFGVRSILLTFLTGAQEFNEVMEYANRVEGRNRFATSVGAGIVSCNAILAERKGYPNKIVVITDGRNNFGGDPVRNANIFRSKYPNGRISAIGIGNVTPAGLNILQGVAGSTGSVLTVADYVELGQKVNELVCNVCEIV